MPRFRALLSRELPVGNGWWFASHLHSSTAALRPDRPSQVTNHRCGPKNHVYPNLTASEQN
jgi:hypothetical protein